MQQQPDPETLRQWMINFIIDHLRDNDAYHLILERNASRYGEHLPLNDPEQDRAELFHELVSTVVTILGSEEEAGKWLKRQLFTDGVGHAAPLDYLRDGGFWALSLLRDILGRVKEAPADPLGFGLYACLSQAFETDLDSCMDLVPAAWNMDDRTFEAILGVEHGYLQAWRHHELKLTAPVRRQLRRVVVFHETLRLHVRPRGYAAWWRRRWAESSLIGARTPLQVWEDEGWQGLDFIKRIFWGQQA